MGVIEQRMRFRADVGVTWEEDGTCAVATDGYRCTLRNVGDLRGALTALCTDDVTEDALLDRTQDSASAARLLHILGTVERAGILQRSVAADGAALATLVPMGRDVIVPILDRQQVQRLSRLVWMHAEDGDLICDSPLRPARVRLHHPRATALLAPLSRGIRLDELDDEAGPAIAALLAAAGALDAETPAQRTWETHDLLFHNRTRMGRHNHPYGGTYRFTDAFPSPPVVKPPMSIDVIALPRVALDALHDDPRLIHVMEGRRSIRSHGTGAIHIDQLGAFLFRTVRMRERIPTDLGELSSRPYPGGGAIYELEIYLTVNRCEGLEPGFYHYAPEAHQLERLDASLETRQALLTGSRYSTLQEADPQILITLASRFGRIAWKYQSMAYAATLKNVGVVMHGMYLVAEAMGLAACALGGGDADLFTRASGTDYYEETSVGEFILGTRP